MMITVVLNLYSFFPCIPGCRSRDDDYYGSGSTNFFLVFQAVGVEMMITMVLVLTVYGAAADENNTESVKGSAPLAIGLSIATCHLFAIPLTGKE